MIPEVDQIDAQIETLRLKRQQIIDDVQAKCKHPAEMLREGEYMSLEYSTVPPFRVCTACGYAEQGWGCGYWKLDSREPVAQMPQDFLRKKYVLKFLKQEDMNELRFPNRPKENPTKVRLARDHDCDF